MPVGRLRSLHGLRLDRVFFKSGFGVIGKKVTVVDISVYDSGVADVVAYKATRIL